MFEPLRSTVLDAFEIHCDERLLVKKMLVESKFFPVPEALPCQIFLSRYFKNISNHQGGPSCSKQTILLLFNTKLNFPMYWSPGRESLTYFGHFIRVFGQDG